jgi:DNA-binding SARP family transcriptional activator
VRSHLPLPWATELALAHIAAGRDAGWGLLDALWPRAQREVRHHADGSSPALRRAARAALVRLPVPPPGHLELRLLGPVELLRDGVPVDAPEWRRERVRSLLAHLVLHGSVHRERLGSDLWPTLDSDAQSRNLRVTLTHLLRVLEPGRSERDASFVIRPHGASLILYPGDCLDSDVWRFDDLRRRAVEADQRAAPSAALGPMREAVALWRDDPAELAAEAWALAQIEERRVHVVELALRAGELLLTRGDPAEAARMGRTALRIDPWSERAHRALVAAYLAAGDSRAARHALHAYRTALAEVGVDPAGHIHELERQLATVLRSTIVGPQRACG